MSHLTQLLEHIEEAIQPLHELFTWEEELISLGQIPRRLRRKHKVNILVDTPSACGGVVHLTTTRKRYQRGF